MAVGGITVTESREAVVDFTTPYHEESNGLILIIQGKRWTFFYEVFKYDTWLCIGCMPFVVAMISYLACIVHTKKKLNRCYILQHILYTYFGNLLGQGNVDLYLTTLIYITALLIC